MKKTCFLSLLILTVIFSACKTKTSEQLRNPEKPEGDSTTGSVERLSPKMDSIVPPGELPEIIAEGFEWTEGPVWLPDQKALLFSDIPNNSVYQWSEQDGLKLYLKPAGYTDTVSRGGETGSNGLLLDKKGQLILCQHGDRRIALMDAPVASPEARFKTLADKWHGKRFNSPNDAVLNSKGEIYFTDPPYGMEHGFEDPKREMKFTGVFKLNSDGKVILLTDRMKAPNGIGLSPDESRLYLANSQNPALWMEYHIQKDGSIDGGRIFHDPAGKNQSGPGAPDGLKVRADGIIFATGPGGVWVFSPDGEHLGTIKTGQATSNCALDKEGKYLYMTADMYLMRIRIKSSDKMDGPSGFN